MENYICINGKKAELTEEQMKALGIELPKVNPFKRVDVGEKYWVIHGDGEVCEEGDIRKSYDNQAFNIANYCTDKAILEQRALHETLNRLLWRYSMEHDGDKIDWKCDSKKYYILYDNNRNIIKCEFVYVCNMCGAVYFKSIEVANAAIEEIIKPFIEAHPDFKW